MKRFLMLVGVAVVAAAMYVAASPASQQAKGPTAKQFRALKAQVATLAKKLKTTQSNLNTLAAVYLHCSLHSEIGINQRGSNSTVGYEFTDGVTTAPTTALDLATSGTPNYVVTPFNSADAACQPLVGLALRHNAGSVLAQKFAQKP
jgi:outer membrane murein-binding lipoprotein Lpp